MRIEKSNRLKPVIGWREWVCLPDWQETRIKVKVDTGAKSSALHAEDIQKVTQNGKIFIQFTLYPNQRDPKTNVNVVAPLVDYRYVRSSNGMRQKRPVILTDVTLMGKTWPIEVTLTNRDVMGFRMLLGRTAIENLFLVDPKHSFLALKTDKIKKGQAL